MTENARSKCENNGSHQLNSGVVLKVGEQQLNTLFEGKELSIESTPPPLLSWSELADSDHLVQFYEDDEFLLNSLFEYADAGLQNGDAVIAVATKPHLIGLEHRLSKKGHDLFALTSTNRYLPLDAAETLSKFMITSFPDPQLFRKVIGAVIERAGNGNRRVRIYGEMVALLWADKKFDAAIRLEQLWNELATIHNFSLCCSYPIQEFDPDVLQPLRAVCATHSVVVPAESYAAANNAHDRLAVITALQQKARALEHEIADRKKTEQQLRESESQYRQLKNQLQKQLEEREELLQREQIARLEAQSANRMKDEFLATVSHELRTPLTTLFGWTRLLRTADLDKQSIGRALEAIERSVQAQKQIVEDLLDVTKIVAGKLRLKKISVELESVIHHAVDDVRSFAEAKKISFRIHLDSQVPPIEADPKRLHQIILNLLSNAIKFTQDNGSIEITVALVNSNVEIAVADQGEGITAEFLPFVFDRFSQADSTTTRKHGGLGLGLAIVRHLVELHSGTVRAESPGPNQGSIFTVSLPVGLELKSLKPEDQTASLPFEILQGIAGRTVLIVENDPDTREMLLVQLQQWSVEANAVRNAEEALEFFEHRVPDLLLSDIGLPRQDGYDLIRKIRAFPNANRKHVPAIAFTASAKSDDRLRAITEGFNLFLRKPIEPQELAVAIYSLTRNTSSH
jgi:signal transduction histidine kinase/ActR/RegA family two-component response regulator